MAQQGRVTVAAAVDLRTVLDIADVDNATVLIDAIDDAVDAATGAVAAGERSEQRIANPGRVDRTRRIAKLQHRGSNGFWRP